MYTEKRPPVPSGSFCIGKVLEKTDHRLSPRFVIGSCLISVAKVLKIGILGALAMSLRAEQPVAFSHKQHVAAGLECLDCHSSADTGAAATIPSVRKCMLCHAKVATGKPEVKKLITYANRKREIPWVRVYNLPREALVKFQHSAHIRAGIDCAACHGDMARVTAAKPMVKHNMGTCLSCHRKFKASEDCATCHY